MRILKKAKGFTIIEVLIVLAIAGLILSIVFIAVPQLQRNARDTKRQSIANRMSSELDSFAGNNSGTYPWVGVGAGQAACGYNAAAAAQSCSDWYTRYICANNAACTQVDTKDPSTGNATPIFYGAGVPTPGGLTPNLWITVGGSCSGSDKSVAGVASTTTKKFAITIALERNGTYYCIDNG